MNKIKKSLKTLIDGTFLMNKTFTKNIWFLLFLVSLAFVYIGIRNKVEKKVNEISELRKEVRNYRSSSITLASELMQISKQTEVLKEVQKRNIGLMEATEPPKKLKIKE